MTIFENKKLERDTFRKIRDGISLNQRENVEKNVSLYLDSLINYKYNCTKKIFYAAPYLDFINLDMYINQTQSRNTFLKCSGCL